MSGLNRGYLFQNKGMILLLSLVDGLLRILPKRKRELPAHVSKILLIKPDHLGDMLLLTSVLPLIHGKYPDASIDIVCNRWNQSILDHNPAIRNRILVNHYKSNREKQPGWKKLLDFIGSYLSSLRKVRRECYDVCLLMRPFGFNLITFAALSKSKYTIGHGTGGFGPLLDLAVGWEAGRHEVEHYLEVLKPLGIKSSIGKLIYDIYPSEEDGEKLERLLHGALGKRERFAVVHPGAGDLRKSLQPHDWTAVVRMMRDKGYRIVLTGSSGERRLAEMISGEDSIILCGDLSLMELACLYRKAAAIVTVDTLAAHLGGWSGVPTAVFYCGINDMKQWRPLGKNVKLLVNNCAHAPCYKGCEGMSCMCLDREAFGKFLKGL